MTDPPKERRKVTLIIPYDAFEKGERAAAEREAALEEKVRAIVRDELEKRNQLGLGLLPKTASNSTSKPNSKKRDLTRSRKEKS